MHSSFAVAGGAVAGLLVLTACSAPPPPEPRGPVHVLAYTVPGSGDATARFSGTIHSRYEADLGFRIAGKIIERHVNIGDHVTAGQVLMRIDDIDYGNAAAAAKANMDAAQAQSDRATASFNRINALLASGSVAQDAFEQAKAARDSAAAGLAAAKAQWQAARDQKGYGELRADAAGVVMSLNGEVGQVVAAGQPVLRLARDGAPEAVVSLPDAGHAVGENITATIYGQAQAVHGRLRQISQAADPASRLFEARYVLDATPAQAPLGATVTIALAAAGPAQAVNVPLSALFDPGTGPQVWIIDRPRNVVSTRKVTVARLDEETAVIAAGLQPGEVVVGAGAQLLHAGETVTPVAETAQ